MAITVSQLALLRALAAADGSETERLPGALFRGDGPDEERLRRDFADLLAEELVRVEMSQQDGSGAYAVLVGTRVTAAGNDLLGLPSGRDAERALEALRAMWFGDSRPPGNIGRTTRVSGNVGTEQATLDRTDGGWALTTEGGTVALSAVEATRQLFDGSFVAIDSLVVPEIADLLFQQAVRQASESVAKLNQARAGLVDVRAADDGDPLPAVLVASALDRSLAASLTATVLAIAACEAQANAWGQAAGGWVDNEDRCDIVGKLQVLAGRRRCTVDLGRAPLQNLSEAARRRNDLVDAKPIPVPAALSGSKVVRPGLSASIDARKACLAVRQSLILIASIIGTDKPAYLAYCPSGMEDDDTVWATAELLTGVRDDPDFAKSTEPAE